VTGPLRILLVDDEVSLQRAMVPLLRARGYAVTVARSGREALELFEHEPPDLVVLDLGLPDLDGHIVCRRLRERGDTPILILSARGAEAEKVAALDEGADDYVTKPFGPEELLARVRAVLRRGAGGETAPRGQLRRGDLVIDCDRRRVFRGGTEIRLTPKEFALLHLLAQHAGRVLTHRTILNALWGPQGGGQPAHLRVVMGQLRRKIEPDPGAARYLVTEPWVGYRFTADSDE
jgi:two-component system KDP operon response regulator KdpE